MTDSVYQRVLGAGIEQLAPELRPYFSGHAGVGVGIGVFEIAGSPRRFLRPVLAYLAWRRILFPEFARDVPFDIANTPNPDGGLLQLRSTRQWLHLGEWFRYAGSFSYRYEER